MSVEKAIDQVEVAGSAAPRAAGEFAGELCLRAGRKRADFFVAEPVRPSRVGSTQSNISTPSATISTICGGVPSPMA